MRKKKVKKKIGRPTKYKAEYCEMLVSHMAEGLSYVAFAGLIGVSEDRLHAWERTNPEFLLSKKDGIAACALFWEKLGLKGVNGEIKNFNSGTWIFNMKNRFGWRDTKDFEIGIQPITVHFERYKEKGK